MTSEIPRERYAWYIEGIPNWDNCSDEGWSKLVNPSKYLKSDESPFCKCGHHVKNHGYSSIFGEEYFCFHKCGDKQYKQIFIDYQSCRIDVDDDLARSSDETRWKNGVSRGNRRCPCEGFEPYRFKENSIVRKVTKKN